MLSKEVRDILEGTHFFLAEGLKSEDLSGKVECMRKGLLLQLEELRIPFPCLHFSSVGAQGEVNGNYRVTSASMPYLNIDQQNGINSRMSMSSSCSTPYSSGSTGGSHSSSTGYSGDGIVSNSNAVTAPTEIQQENYEELEDMETCISEVRSKSNSRADIRGIEVNDTNDDREEEAYAEEVDPVSFRILVGKCDHHGELTKKSKSLLGVRNMKSYRVVLFGSLLYFYMKESDDKQKKVIDLSGYNVEEASMDENKINSRRRDFGFQLVGPGKKTHVLSTNKKTSRDRWIFNISRAISSQDSISHSNTNSRSDIGSTEGLEKGRADLGDYYEVLSSEEMEEDSSVTSSQWRSSSNLSHNGHSNSRSAYYTVPEEGEVENDSSPVYYNEGKSRVPPDRPLPPEVSWTTQQQKRPLPEAPNSKVCYSEKVVDDEIYCEIDEDLSEQTVINSKSVKDSLSKSLDDVVGTDSLSKEIFKAIIERRPSQSQKFLGKKCDTVSLRSNTSSENERCEVSNDFTQSGSWKFFKEVKNPAIPSKGQSRSSDSDTEYSVPSSSSVEAIYDVPSSKPVKIKETTNISHTNSHQSKVDDTPIPNISEKYNLDSLEVNQNTQNKQNGHTTETVSNETKNTSKETENNSSNSSNYVKELVAKLNKTDVNTTNNSQSFNTNLFRKSTNSLKSKEVVGLSGTTDTSSSWTKDLKSSRSFRTYKNQRNVSSNENSIAISDVIKTKNDKNELFIEEQKNTHCLDVEAPMGFKDSEELFVAKFAFVATTSTQLSFSRGDEILVKNAPSEQRFWKAELKGKSGLVPREYLRKKNEQNTDNE